jgi:hypothetical protein
MEASACPLGERLAKRTEQSLEYRKYEKQKESSRGKTSARFIVRHKRGASKELVSSIANRSNRVVNRGGNRKMP